jgi:hypothetical protein
MRGGSAGAADQSASGEIHKRELRLRAQLPLSLRLFYINHSDLISLTLTSAARRASETAGTRMVRRSSAFFRFVLVAALSGLNALCLMGAVRTHGLVQGPARPAAVTRADLPAAILRSRSSSSDELFAAGPDPFVFSTAPLPSGHGLHAAPPRIMHAFPRVSAPASLFRAVCDTTPEFDETLLARENVLALGGAPRAPDLGRAPPAA